MFSSHSLEMGQGSFYLYLYCVMSQAVPYRLVYTRLVHDRKQPKKQTLCDGRASSPGQARTVRAHVIEIHYQITRACKPKTTMPQFGNA